MSIYPGKGTGKTQHFQSRPGKKDQQQQQQQQEEEEEEEEEQQQQQQEQQQQQQEQEQRQRQRQEQEQEQAGGPYHPPLWCCHWACFFRQVVTCDDTC